MQAPECYLIEVVLVHGVDVDGVCVPDFDEFGEGLEDEDERDENGETFLREARHVTHQGAQVERHAHDQNDGHPHPDKKTERQVRQLMFSVCKWRGQT